MHDLLERNEQLLGIYTLWEPNALDGKDREYANKEAHDATGRFIPYVVRSDGKIIVEASIDYDKEGTGDYYLVPKKQRSLYYSSHIRTPSTEKIYCLHR